MKALDRRSFMLEATLLAGGLAAVLSGCGKSGEKSEDEKLPSGPPLGPYNQPARALVNSRRDATEAAKIGRRWLKAQRTRPTYDQLVSRIVGEDYVIASPVDLDALKARIHQRHLADLTAARFETVNGWYLSATEVHLYALVALAPPKKTPVED